MHPQAAFGSEANRLVKSRSIVTLAGNKDLKLSFIKKLRTRSKEVASAQN